MVIDRFCEDVFVFISLSRLLHNNNNINEGGDLFCFELNHTEFELNHTESESLLGIYSRLKSFTDDNKNGCTNESTVSCLLIGRWLQLLCDWST